jgi:ribosomal protein L2
MAKGIYYLETAQKAIDKVNTFVSPLTKLINMGLVMQFRRVVRGTAVATIDSTPGSGGKGGKGGKGIGGSRAVGAAGGLLAGMAMGAEAASLVNDYIV